MTFKKFNTLCLSLPGVQATYPFDQTTLVFKVLGKMFVLADSKTFSKITLKCKPEKALLLKKAHTFITPGYYMNKKHWITIDLSQNVDDDFLTTHIKMSYTLVVAGLPKKIKDTLNA